MNTNAVIQFEAHQGKFTKTDAATRVATRTAQGLSPLAQLALGIDKKAATEKATAVEMAHIIGALAGGNIRLAYAATVAKAKINESMLTENGKAPYSEWLRLQATLATLPQTTKAGKLTPAAQALKLAQWLSAESAAMREARNQNKISA